jgi:hypothetical protein
MIMDSIIFYLLIFFIGFLGSFIGTISAGASIIIFSGLTLLGVPPHIAIATDTFGSIGFRLGSFYNYVKYKKVVWNLIVPLTILGIIGSVIGASILVRIDEGILSKIIGIVLLLLLPLIFFKRNVGTVRVVISKTRRVITHFWYFLVETWAAFFPPGSGFLEMYVMTKGYGLTILQTKGTKRIPGLIAELSAVVVFVIAGIINFKIGFVLIFGSLIGSHLGSHVAIKKGDDWVKSLMVLMIVIVSIKMIFF